MREKGEQNEEGGGGEKGEEKEREGRKKDAWTERKGKEGKYLDV